MGNVKILIWFLFICFGIWALAEFGNRYIYVGILSIIFAIIFIKFMGWVSEQEE